MALHYTKVRYGVEKYSVLHTEGKSADEVKTAIAADEKGFDEEGVNQIYEAIVNPVVKEEKPETAKYYVVKEFRDLNDFDLIHKIESDVSDFDADRLEKLVELGLVEKV